MGLVVYALNARFGYPSRKSDPPNLDIQMLTGEEENIPANNGTI